MVRKGSAMVMALVLIAQNAAWARQTQTAPARSPYIAWEELGALVVDRTVALQLPDGTRLGGAVLAVRPEAMVLDIRKTSNKKLHPKGQAEIPRTGLTEVRVIRYAGPAMRIIGGILGGVGGAAGVGGLAFVSESAAVILPALIVGIPVAAVSGYYAGKLADRRTTRLYLRTETAAEAAPGENGDVQ